MRSQIVHMDTIRILCFGDSLTAGYSLFGLKFTPYAETLRPWLEASWPQTKLYIDVDGLSGDRVVSGSFLSRIESKCKTTSLLLGSDYYSIVLHVYGVLHGDLIVLRVFSYR